MSASPNCDSCGIPLRGDELLMARRRGTFFFCPPCGAKRERSEAIIIGTAVGVVILAFLVAGFSLSSRLGQIENRLDSLESRARP